MFKVKEIYKYYTKKHEKIHRGNCTKPLQLFTGDNFSNKKHRMK